MKKSPQVIRYEKLKIQIGDLLIKGREKASIAINTILVKTYWQIG